MGFKRDRKRACPFFGESKPSHKLRFAYCKVNPRPKKRVAGMREKYMEVEKG